jgi:hypothetical protein
MEQRKIIIVDSSSNRKVTVNTDATNFGELKRAARAAGINYEGKDWLEGLTKTSPVSDDSLLPVNVNYKGTVTNNLVYMLTNTNKRIRSGMNRQEAYAEIKKLGLADGVKKKFGRNFTQVGTNDLIDFINKNGKKGTSAPANKSKVEDIRKEMEAPKAAPTTGEVNFEAKYNEVVGVIAKFLTFMPKSILDDAAEAAKNLTPETVVEEVDFSQMSIDELKRQFGR